VVLTDYESDASHCSTAPLNLWLLNIPFNVIMKAKMFKMRFSIQVFINFRYMLYILSQDLAVIIEDQFAIHESVSLYHSCFI